MNMIFDRLVEVGGPPLAKRMLQLHVERCKKALDKLTEALHQHEPDTAQTYVEYLIVCTEEVGVDSVIPKLKELRGLVRNGDYVTCLQVVPRLRLELKEQHSQIASELEALPS